MKSARQMDRAFQDFLGGMPLLVAGKKHKQINPKIHQKLPLEELLTKNFISKAREWRTLDDEVAAEGKTAAERIAKHTKKLQYRLEDDSPYSCLRSKVDSIDSELSGVYDGERAVLNSDSPLGFKIEERSSALGAEELDGDVVAEGYQASVCHWQGFRPNQEDAHILNEIEVEIADKSLKIPVFGVLDGHGGAACSQYVRENLPRILKEKLEQFSKGKFPLSEEAIYNALKIAFVELDAEYKGRDGTTAVASIVIGDKLYTANAGDSRAVLSREEGEDSYHIYELSKDQDSAFSEDGYESFEESSVVKRGGTFSWGRIDGNLKLGRAIGDPNVHVSARPKISCRTIQPGDTLTFACDGLWDSTAAPSEDPTKLSSREIGAFAASIDPTKAAKKLTQLGVKLERERFGSDKAGDNISVLVVRVPANVKASEEKHDEGDEEASVDISVLLEQAKNFIPEGEELSLELVEGSADLLQKVANALTDDSIPLEDKSALLGALDSAIVSSSEGVYSALIEKIEAMDTNKGALFEALAVIATETGETDLVLERAVGLFQRSVDAGVDLHPENKGRFLMSIESLPKGVLDKDPSKKERIKAFVTELAKEGDDFAIEVYCSIKLSEIEDVSAITYNTLELWEGISDSMKARVYCSLAIKILTPSTNKEIGYDYFPKTTDSADKQSSFNELSDELVSTLGKLNEEQLLSDTHPIILVTLKRNFTDLGRHLELTSKELSDKTKALDPLFFASLKSCITFFKNGSYRLA
ncbi:MAG: hypothetical protein GWP59_03225, partial [Chlamydiales bacterium]|nr:hypothetical protein [Chlamydiales bacterium]